MIAIAVLAYNRVHLLRQCVEKVLGQTSEATTEIVIWDNASSDGTVAYLDLVTDPRVRVVHHHQNIGLNAYPLAFAMTQAAYLVTLDEDVIDAPPGWDASLLDAFERLPEVGYLATNQVDDERSLCANLMHHRDRHLYSSREINGVRVLEGPVGGWCGMTSRTISDEVGGFPHDPKHVFFHFDDIYLQSIAKFGYGSAILEDLEVFHASGPAFSEVLPEKHEFYTDLEKTQARKDAVKRLLLHAPLAKPLNDRYNWFHPPAESR